MTTMTDTHKDLETWMRAQMATDRAHYYRTRPTQLALDALAAVRGETVEWLNVPLDLIDLAVETIFDTTED